MSQPAKSAWFDWVRPRKVYEKLNTDNTLPPVIVVMSVPVPIMWEYQIRVYAAKNEQRDSLVTAEPFTATQKPHKLLNEVIEWCEEHGYDVLRVDDENEDRPDPSANPWRDNT